MDWIILWFFLIVSIFIFSIWLIKPPFKNWTHIFFFTGYFSIFIAVILTEEKYFEFPVRFLPKYFSSSILFEFLVLPIICVLFNQVTWASKITGTVGYSSLFSLILTTFEGWFLKHTHLIVYYKWSLWHTFFLYLFSLFFLNI